MSIGESKQQKGATGFDNQKQLRKGKSQASILHLSGDKSTDNRAEASSEVSVQEMQAMLGGPFMHPMHDASADQQFAPPLAPQPDRASHEDPANRPVRPPRDPYPRL